MLRNPHPSPTHRLLIMLVVIGLGVPAPAQASCAGGGEHEATIDSMHGSMQESDVEHRAAGEAGHPHGVDRDHVSGHHGAADAPIGSHCGAGCDTRCSGSAGAESIPTRVSVPIAMDRSPMGRVWNPAPDAVRPALTRPPKLR